MKKNKVLILKKLKKNLTSHGGFKYPKSGKVEASDFQNNTVCGKGLHGLLWGTGDFDISVFGEKYCILEVEASQLVNFADKVKFRSGKVVLITESQQKAYKYLYKRSPKEYRDRINYAIQVTDEEEQFQGGGYYSTQKAGRKSVQKAGHYSTQKAGYDSNQKAGNRSNQTAGSWSIQKAGDDSNQTAGNFSTQKAGYDSNQKAGDDSNQTAGNFSTQKAGYDSNQKAGNDSNQTAGNFSTQKAGHFSTQTAWRESTQTAGDCSSQKAGNESTQTAGNGSTQTAGHGSTHIINGTAATITTGKDSVVTFLKPNGERVVLLSGKDFPVNTKTKFVDCKVKK